MLLLKDCEYIATFDDERRELRGADILIEGNRISRIGENIDPPESARIIDCGGHLVIPGMVNTHHHFFQTLTRNLPGAQNATLFDWLTYLYPIWSGLDEEAIRVSTRLACAELLLTGATTSSDHLYLYPRGFSGDMSALQFEAAEEMGIRFSPSRGSMTLGQSEGGLPPESVVQRPGEVVADMERVIDQFHDPSPLSMRRVTLAPCSPFSVDENLMMETAKMARRKGVVLHTHLAETEDEEEFCLEKYGERPLALMEKWGWLGPDVYFAHGIWFDDGELELLAETDTGVAHCPSSNMRLGSGIARIREMRELGIRIGLGVDGSASNDSSDMLGEARNAMLLQRVKYGSDALGARKVLELATRGGASLLGMDYIGSLEEGKAADIAIFDLSRIQYAGAQSDPLAAIVFSGYDHGAAYTIVNGRVVVAKGKLAVADESELAESANRASERLLRRAGVIR